MSVVIDKERLVQAIRDALPKLTVSRRVVKTDGSGVYSEPLGNQIACISPSPDIVCFQHTDGSRYIVRTYYASTDVDQNELRDDTIVHTHRLKVAPGADVIIVEVSV